MFHLPLRKNNYLEHNSNAVRGGALDRHYFLFTPLHLRNMLASLKFKDIKIEYIYDSNNRNFKYVKWLYRFLFSIGFLRNVAYPRIKAVAIK